MQDTTKQAFCEVYDIINHMDKQMKSKISDKFIDFIEENRDLNYKVNIDYSKSIANQNLLYETKVLLSLIYRDYICDEEKREKLIKQDKDVLKEQEKKLEKKYEINFKYKKENKNQPKKPNSMIVQKQKWYEKIVEIYRYIKCIFRN